ncbi:zinc knuckle domain-containing protein [Ditylenchus destructor]|uniref:Zinc knuckle domain-containing protein n=1 Tax=Ditylenchus destructor TaxID=166010 RepID=A0AAD4NGH9_9BILA|nr:zinc knuckle domain-containing protein [Ditylenchus destructor]
MLQTAKSVLEQSFFTKCQRRSWGPLQKGLGVFEQNVSHTIRLVDKGVKDLKEEFSRIRGKLQSLSVARVVQSWIYSDEEDQRTWILSKIHKNPRPGETKVDKEHKRDQGGNDSEVNDSEEQALESEDRKDDECIEILVLDAFSPSVGSLPMYDGNPTVSFGKWLERFMDILNLSSTTLDEDQKLNRLRYCLSGRARAELNVAQPAPKTLDEAIKVLKGKFENYNAKIIAHQALFICHQAPGERVFVFANRLSEVVRAALAGENEQVIQKRLLEEFVDRLTPDLQFEVKGARPDTYSKAYELAEHYELLMPVRNQMYAPGQILVAELAHKVNALAIERRSNGKACYYCGRPGHLIRDCRKRDLGDQNQNYGRSRDNEHSQMHLASRSHSRSADRNESRSQSRDRLKWEPPPQVSVRFRDPKRSDNQIRLATVLPTVLTFAVSTQMANALEYSFKPTVYFPYIPLPLFRLPKDLICPSANWIPVERIRERKAMCKLPPVSAKEPISETLPFEEKWHPDRVLKPFRIANSTSVSFWDKMCARKFKMTDYQSLTSVEIGLEIDGYKSKIPIHIFDREISKGNNDMTLAFEDIRKLPFYCDFKRARTAVAGALEQPVLDQKMSKWPNHSLVAENLPE